MKLCVFILFFSFQQQIYGRARHAIDDNLEDGDDMNLLRGDAVRAGEEEENKWFKAISPTTLDKLITEMNSMNRWFAKVVKYWDDFTAGNNGASVLEKEGKGIKDGTELEVVVDGEDGASTSEGPMFGGDDTQIVDGGEEEKSGDGEEKTYDEEKPKDNEEEKSKGDGEEKPYDMGDEKPYDMGDEKPYDEKTEEHKEEKDEKEDKEESDKKSEDDKKSDEKSTADDEEKGKDEEDKKSENEEARRRRRRRF